MALRIAINGYGRLHALQFAFIDTTQTRFAGERLLNLLIWFDNEWGYANRLLELAHYWLRRAV